MTAEIRALDAIWESHYNMMVLHGDEDYDWTRKCDPAVKQDFTYVCFDAAGKPNAYTTFRLANEPDGRNLVCSRFCFADKGGFDELMRLYKSLSSDHRFVKFSRPPTRPCSILCRSGRWVRSAGACRARAWFAP